MSWVERVWVYFFAMNDGFLGWVGLVICHFGFPVICGIYFLPTKKVVKNSKRKHDSTDGLTDLTNTDCVVYKLRKKSAYRNFLVDIK